MKAMKETMISVPPTICEKVANGDCTILVKKTRPKIDTPFKCYIYATKSGDRIVLKNDRVYEIAKNLTGKVIGHFVCDRIDYWQYHYKSDVMHIADMSELSCVSIEDLLKYSNGGETTIYGWHISDLVIYDEPKELGEFEHSCPTNLKKKPYINCLYCKYNFVGNRGNKCDCKVTRPPMSWCYVEEKE